MQKNSTSDWSPESVHKILLFLKILRKTLLSVSWCYVAMSHFWIFTSISNENSNSLWLFKACRSPQSHPVQTSSAVGKGYFPSLQT